MPTYSEDSRIRQEYRTLRTNLKTGKDITDTTGYVSKCSGTVKRFSGSNSGRFIPGEFRVNPMSASRTTYVYGNSDVTGYRTYGTGPNEYIVRSKVTGYFTGRTAFRAPTSVSYNTWDPALTGYAMQRAFAALLSSDMDLGEFLAELPETISMVRGGVVSIQRAIKSATHSGFTWEKADRARRALLGGSSLKRLPKKVANAWLTWRYGIRPLVWDVQDLIRAANSLATSSDWSALQRRRGRAQTTRDESFEYTLRTPWGDFVMDAKEYVGIQQRCEAVVYFKYGTNWGPYQDILLKYGLHPNQIPYLLWQLRPLSFMLDWFVDVGTWVKAITPKWGMKIYGCSVSQKTDIRSTRISTVRPNSAYDSLTGTAHDTCRVESIERRQPTLQGEVPRLKPDIILSIQQQADILSVLLQRALSNRRH